MSGAYTHGTAHLIGSGGLSRADGPNGLVGNDDLAPVLDVDRTSDVRWTGRMLTVCSRGC